MHQSQSEAALYISPCVDCRLLKRSAHSPFFLPKGIDIACLRIIEMDKSPDITSISEILPLESNSNNRNCIYLSISSPINQCRDKLRGRMYKYKHRNHYSTPLINYLWASGSVIVRASESTSCDTRKFEGGRSGVRFSSSRSPFSPPLSTTRSD